MRGITMDLDAQLGWVTDHVSPSSAEFVPPVQICPGYMFRYANGSFGHGDADVLYGLIRSQKPKRIVELGSGHTSVIIRQALQRNAEEGTSTLYSVFDPYPTDHLAGTPMAFKAKPLAAERLPDDVFEQLEAGDILFVDTTHTVKIGGDVVRIVLESLPLLAPGVLVHFHDVFLPYSYPRAFFEEHEYYWAEQYLVQAFLAYNSDFEVMAGLQALARERSAEFAALVPSMTLPGANPGSFWIRRRPQGQTSA